MAVKPIPDGYSSVTPYLIVTGVDRLIAFLEQSFDAKATACMKMPDGRIGHAEVKIGDAMIMMGEAGGPWTPMPTCLHLYVADADATFRKAVAAGGTVVKEMADQFYGDRSGTVKDHCGNLWSIATHVEDVSPEEMERRHQEYVAKNKVA